MIPKSQHYSRERDFLDLPSWLWLWLPVVYLALHFVITGISKELYDSTLGGGELGINELLTMCLLFVAIFIGLHTLWVMRGMQDWRLWIWIFLGTLGCVYFGGEEASWGQHIVGWESGDEWQDFNDQQETNLHNSEQYGWLLDQLPRNLLTLGIFAGGLVAPLWRRWRGIALNPASIHYWIWPTMICLPVAIIAVFVTTPDKIYSGMTGEARLPLRIAAGEVKEFYIAYFLLIYLNSFNLRLRQLKKGMAGE